MKKIVDAAMTVLLMCLMAYQVTGEAAHEWIGMGIALTAFCGMSMSGYAVPFLYGMVPVMYMMAAVIIGILLQLLVSP